MRVVKSRIRQLGNIMNMTQYLASSFACAQDDKTIGLKKGLYEAVLS